MTEDYRPDLYGICHRLVGRETAGQLADAIEVALGWKPQPPEFDAVSAALAAYADAKGEHWDAGNGGRWGLADLVHDAVKVEAMLRP